MLLRHSFGALFFIFLLVFLAMRNVQGIIIQGPSNVTYIPGRNTLPIMLTCNVTGFASWIVNGTPYFTSQLLAGLLNGHSANDTDIVINIPMNDTEYICVSNTINNAVTSTPAFLYIAGPPAMVGNIMIDVNAVIIDNNNVSFTLYWDEPFANFDPIVNYAITINCSDTSCPVMSTVATTSASVNFITDLSMVSPLSITASNSVGASDPSTIMIGVPDRVDNVNILCGAVDLINRCTVTWNKMADDMAVPISYDVYYFLTNITNGSITIDSSMATIDLPAIDGNVNVVVTAVNVFGSGLVSDIAMDKIMSAPVNNATSALNTPYENRTLHSITVNCSINPDSTADMCEVRATANSQMPRTAIAPIINGVATVIVNGLMCEVEYTIVAGGTLNGDLVGPRSSHGTITAGFCPQVMTTTTSPATATTMADPTAVLMPTATLITTSTMLPVTTESLSEGDDGNDGAVIAGVVGGILGAIVVIIIIIVIVYCCMKHREKSSRPRSTPMAISNIPPYDDVQDPVISDTVKMEPNPAYHGLPSDHVKMKTNPAYQGLTSDHVKMDPNPAYQLLASNQSNKGPDPAYQDLTSYCGRASCSKQKPAGNVNYYEEIINKQNITMTKNSSSSIP